MNIPFSFDEAISAQKVLEDEGWRVERRWDIKRHQWALWCYDAADERPVIVRSIEGMPRMAPQVS